MTFSLRKITEFCIVNLRNIGFGVALFCAISILSSCFKKDTPITHLPPKTGSTSIQVQMGPAHDSTFYISLEAGKVVGKSLHYTWDLAFDANADGKHILLNSGKSTRAIKTNFTNMNLVTTLPANADTLWGYDAPTLTVDSTCIGDWYDVNNNSKNEVYIIRLADKSGNFTYKKIQFVSVSTTNYVIRIADLASISFTTFSVPKNESYNYTFFAFATFGEILQIEPPKTTWDMQITRYSHVYQQLTPVVNYQVNGALANTYKTQSANDTLNEKLFSTFSIEDAKAMQYYPFPNGIGFTWKNFSISQNDYIVYDKYIYAVRTQNNQLFKLHFTAYKTAAGESYAPKFEFERLE
jgi:hypothetical protein